MPDIASLLLAGSGNLWLYIPSAVLLGALHGLEPGHSKTMMAALIVAIRGTVAQAVMLGLAATISHTAVVWALAMLGLYLGAQVQSEHTEAWFQLVSGLIVLAMAGWMLWQIRRQTHGHEHDHEHHDEHSHDHDHDHEHEHEDEHEHEHDHEPMDAHARAHAEDIRRRFSQRQVTNGQILLFGLTGGLIPCPASITVLLVCLQLKQFTLGATLVLCFSIGLALTLVLAGVIAAVGVRHAERRWSGLNEWARKAPYFSGVIVLLVGLYISWHGLTTLTQ